MELIKRCMVLAVLLGCTMSSIRADPDCENLRDRRDEMDQCCQAEKIISLKDADECADASDEATEPHTKIMCSIECKLKSLGVVNDNTIVPEKALEFAERLEDGWKETAKGIVTKCIEGIETMKSKMQDKDRGMKCSPVSGFFIMCLMKHTFMQCPADKWQNTSFCNKIRNGECHQNRA